MRDPVTGERRHFAGRVGRAQQPNMHLVEQRDARPGETLELLVVHRGAARDVLHLERVAGRVRPRRHDLDAALRVDDAVAAQMASERAAVAAIADDTLHRARRLDAALQPAAAAAQGMSFHGGAIGVAREDNPAALFILATAMVVEPVEFSAVDRKSVV